MTSDLKARLDAMVDAANPPQRQPIEFDKRGLHVAQLETTALNLLSRLDAAEAQVKALTAERDELKVALEEIAARGPRNRVEMPRVADYLTGGLESGDVLEEYGVAYEAWGDQISADIARAALKLGGEKC